MKPLTAVATFILSQLTDINEQALFDHAQDYKQKGTPLTNAQQDRVLDVLDDFRTRITALLRSRGAEVGDPSLGIDETVSSPDDAPELTKDFFEQAEISLGAHVVRPAKGAAVPLPVDVLAVLGEAMSQHGFTSIEITR